ncbi:MAG: hypothetical protein WBC40_11485 [Halobacteriota archaeon]
MQSLSGDRAGASAIGAVLMVAVVEVVAAVVAGFTTGVVWSTVINPHVSIVIEDAEAAASHITLVHIGREEVKNAFAPSSPPSYFLNVTVFENMEIRINGSVYEGWASLNAGEIAKRNFVVGDELELGFASGSGRTLSHGDTITIVYAPNGQVLAWWNV